MADDDVLSDDETGSQPYTGPAPKMDGWGLGGGKTTKEDAIFEDSRLKMDAPTPDDEEEDDSDEDIPAIMDLDKQADEDLGMKMADAPSQEVGVTSLEDLNKELKTAVPFTKTESGIDLKLLTKALTPESMIRELDEPMNFNFLFTSIKSELQTEKDAQEEKESKLKLGEPIGDSSMFDNTKKAATQNFKF